eukprot:CAMPEP_0202100156 /NCGR_PEP_ID=MMETSP0965-20130614/2983_1 /ASSEMBLY_ACC=CAM_ASM_000507 /TAXON_ID=4773 /ORGANISM="Schizochytrium aggregatum, Strain ATCC28209" /LENGTH=109 /DNA_ID=CAMNT_0048668797 /DNA_START=238 /DNA_END=568 /DNA_ORIENTATION=+
MATSHFNPKSRSSRACGRGKTHEKRASGPTRAARFVRPADIVTSTNSMNRGTISAPNRRKNCASIGKMPTSPQQGDNKSHPPWLARCDRHPLKMPTADLHRKGLKMLAT